MKFKLKDIDFNNMEYVYNINTNNGLGNSKLISSKLINLTYMKDELEFQTPKVIIKKIVKENDKEYLFLQIIGNEGCKTFYSKIKELEENHNRELLKNKDWFNKNLEINNIKSIFKEDIFTVKIPFKYSKPIVKIYDKDSRLFNYYSLKPGMEVMCLLSCNNIWVNFDNTTTYNLIVKEILITKVN